MRSSSLLLLLTLSLSSIAQEKNLIIGKVIHKGDPLENVHVSNISTNKFSVTNKECYFTSNSKSSDTLVFSHISMRNLILILTNEDASRGSIQVEMIERDNQHREVLIEDSNIDVVKVGIIEESMEVPTINERRLLQQVISNTYTS